MIEARGEPTTGICGTGSFIYAKHPDKAGHTNALEYPVMDHWGWGWGGGGGGWGGGLKCPGTRKIRTEPNRRPVRLQSTTLSTRPRSKMTLYIIVQGQGHRLNLLDNLTHIYNKISLSPTCFITALARYRLTQIYTARVIKSPPLHVLYRPIIELHYVIKHGLYCIR